MLYFNHHFLQCNQFRGLYNTNRLGLSVKQVVTIEYLNSDLYGCAVIDGRNWHVVGALPGETVLAKIIKKNRNFVLAIAEEITNASEFGSNQMRTLSYMRWMHNATYPIC